VYRKVWPAISGAHALSITVPSDGATGLSELQAISKEGLDGLVLLFACAPKAAAL